MPVDHSWRAAASAVHLLHRASRVADAVFGRLVGSALTPRQFVVLATVAENEGINQMAFIEATGIDRSSVAELVQRLVKQGLVQRRRTRRDARAYSVRLTAKGQKLLRDTLPAVRRADDAVLSGADQGEALALLCRLSCTAPVRVRRAISQRAINPTQTRLTSIARWLTSRRGATLYGF